MRVPHDGELEMDPRTIDIAEVIEQALEDVGGCSPLYRMMADHAARAVTAWMDYQAQTAPTLLAENPGPIPA